MFVRDQARIYPSSWTIKWRNISRRICGIPSGTVSVRHSPGELKVELGLLRQRKLEAIDSLDS